MIQSPSQQKKEFQRHEAPTEQECSNILSLSGEMISKVPQTVTGLVNLKELDLSSNLLTDLPNSLGRMKALQILTLTWNKLSALPDTISQLTELRELYLGFNNFKNIPECVGSLRKLVTLEANDNCIRKLNQSIGQLIRLKRLQIQFNDIQVLDHRISHCEDLTDINVMGNPLVSPPLTIIMNGSTAMREYVLTEKHLKQEQRFNQQQHTQNNSRRPIQLAGSSSGTIDSHSNPRIDSVAPILQEATTLVNVLRGEMLSLESSDITSPNRSSSDNASSSHTNQTGGDGLPPKSSPLRRRRLLSIEERTATVNSISIRSQTSSSVLQTQTSSQIVPDCPESSAPITPSRSVNHFNRLPRTQLEPLPRGVALEGRRLRYPSDSLQVLDLHPQGATRDGNSDQPLSSIRRQEVRRVRASQELHGCLRRSYPSETPRRNSRQSVNQLENHRGPGALDRYSMEHTFNSNNDRQREDDLTIEDANCVRQLLQRNRNSNLLASLEPYFDSIPLQSSEYHSSSSGTQFNTRSPTTESHTNEVVKDACESFQSDDAAFDRSCLPENNDPSIPKAFLCPITLLVMVDPVVASDGHTYEKSAIAKWFIHNDTSPMTAQRLPTLTLTPNYSIKSMISDYIDKMKDS